MLGNSFLSNFHTIGALLWGISFLNSIIQVKIWGGYFQHNYSTKTLKLYLEKERKYYPHIISVDINNPKNNKIRLNKIYSLFNFL